MKKYGFIIAASSLLLSSCINLYLPPKNIVTDDDLLNSENGVEIYMAKIYSLMPWEDFKYMAEWGFDYSGWLNAPGIDGCGEAVNRDGVCQTFRGESTPYWGEAFKLIYYANHLIETMPEHSGAFSEIALNEYIGTGYFARAMAFYQMARRFGGIPLVTHTIAYPNDADKLEVPRATEEETWNQICADFDMAAQLLPETESVDGYANRYAALAYKAEAMLYAGSVAKYNETVPGRLTGLGEKTGVRVIGFDESTWQAASIRYFSEAYKAARAVMDSGRYSLYKNAWKDGDREAQYKNMVDLFSDVTSNKEAILIRKYSYPSYTHSIDAYCSPYIFRYPLCSGSCPTLDFVELFDGFDRYADGTIRVTDGSSPTSGHYLEYDTTMDFFANAEPRLRAYVILPGDEFREEKIELYTGIYTGSTPISPLWDDYSYGRATSNFYQNSSAFSDGRLVMSPYSGSMQVQVDVDGVKMNASGANGPFYAGDGSSNEANLSGFYLRKWLNPDPAFLHGEGKSEQPWILMRYADVLLAAAEAGVELSLAGAACPVEGDDMLAVATQAITDIRERAGADALTQPLKADIDSRNIVRRERRKELAFEHKSKWDVRRWRVQHYEARSGFWGEVRNYSCIGNTAGYRLRGLYPFYSSVDKKFFFDANWQFAREKEFLYDTIDYYFAIPGGEVSKSAYIDQQPNR